MDVRTPAVPWPDCSFFPDASSNEAAAPNKLQPLGFPNPPVAVLMRKLAFVLFPGPRPEPQTGGPDVACRRVFSPPRGV